MSILTNKQINEIVNFSSISRDVRDMFENELRTWNETQEEIDFSNYKLDWENIPDEVENIEVSIDMWSEFQEEYIGVLKKIKFHRPKQSAHPQSAHPQAAMIAKYAEVAARRSDPWVEFERCLPNTYLWHKIDCDFTFLANLDYRHIGEAK